MTFVYWPGACSQYTRDGSGGYDSTLSNLSSSTHNDTLWRFKHHNRHGSHNTCALTRNGSVPRHCNGTAYGSPTHVRLACNTFISDADSKYLCTRTILRLGTHFRVFGLAYFRAVFELHACIHSTWLMIMGKVVKYDQWYITDRPTFSTSVESCHNVYQRSRSAANVSDNAYIYRVSWIFIGCSTCMPTWRETVLHFSFVLGLKTDTLF